MSQFDPQSQLLQELINRRPDDPLRQALEARLLLASPAEIEQLRAMLAESDRIYAQLQQVEMPKGLEQKLLELPGAKTGARPWWELQLDWKLVAAVLLICLTTGGYVLWPSQPKVNRTPVMDEQLAMRITDQAVADDQAPLDFSGGDPKAVQSALSTRGYSFPVMVLQPRAKLDLQGGGHCEIAGTPAVFTRWRGDGNMYTVYQFDGRKLGAPPTFQSRLITPTQLWQNDHHYRVVIWPGAGGACTWALVMDNDKAVDAFSEVVY